MRKCNVCGNASFKNASVEQVFNIKGRIFLVENVPAEICERCGETTFSRETAEHVRRLAHGNGQPKRHVSLDVFAYA